MEQVNTPTTTPSPVYLLEFIKNLWLDQGKVLAHTWGTTDISYLVVGYERSPAYDIYLVTKDGASIKHRWTDAKERDWSGISVREIYCQRILDEWVKTPIRDDV